MRFRPDMEELPPKVAASPAHDRLDLDLNSAERDAVYVEVRHPGGRDVTRWRVHGRPRWDFRHGGDVGERCGT
jgi:hypothetical protein